MPFEKTTELTHSADSLQLAYNDASHALSRCANEAEVFGIGAMKGAVQTGADRIAHDQVGLLSQGAAAAASGMMIGFARNEYPAIVGTAFVLGTAMGLYDLANSSQDQRAMLSRAWTIAWKDPKDINEATDLVSKAAGRFAFDTAYVTAVGALGHGVGVKSWRQLHESSERPRGRLDSASYSSEKGINRDLADSFGRLYENGQPRYYTGAGRLTIKSTPNVYLEKVRRPSEEMLGLSEYSGKFEHPGPKDYSQFEL